MSSVELEEQMTFYNLQEFQKVKAREFYFNLVKIEVSEYQRDDMFMRFLGVLHGYDK